VTDDYFERLTVRIACLERQQAAFLYYIRQFYVLSFVVSEVALTERQGRGVVDRCETTGL
jgi:hypothetical protein